MPNSSENKIPVIYGRMPKPHEKEYREWNNYESGKAEEEAKKVSGPFEEAWLNVVHAYEPVSMPAFDKILAIENLRRHLRGKVMDVAAGSCWLSAKLSHLPEVAEVFTVDLSEKFMRTAGTRVMTALGADFKKIRFVVTNFNEIPLETASVDCAMLFAALHHSLSPIKTLQEIGRCLKPGGVIMVLENPPASIRIRQARKKALGLSEDVTEIAYTREELEYLILNSKVGKLTTFTFDILSRQGMRIKIRKFFRSLGIEHLVLNPPTYLFLVEKEN